MQNSKDSTAKSQNLSTKMPTVKPLTLDEAHRQNLEASVAAIKRSAG